MLYLFRPPHRTTTLCCFGAVLLALFLAKFPNDTKSDWFHSAIRPSFMPRELERKIGLIWTGLFLLTGFGISAALASTRPRPIKVIVVGLTLGMLVLNMSYTFVFTYLHDLALATGIAASLATWIAATIAIAGLDGLWLTAALQLPHFAWVCFATAVTHSMHRLNSLT